MKVFTKFKLLLAAVAVAGGLGFFASASGASALHLALSRSQPMKDSTVTVSPAAIQLWFTEPVKAPVTAIRLLASDSSVVVMDSLTIGATAKDPVSAKIKAPLKPGSYRVMWRTAGNDSHVISGEFTFTYRAAEQRQPARELAQRN
jgi:methionine-rich copper-binding protein CopC